MAFFRLLYKATLLCLCLAACGTSCSAQLYPKDPVKWWPDPSTGLMWAEHAYSGHTHGLLQLHGQTWQQAVNYCAALKLGGFTGWRIPTLDEVKAIATTRHGVVITTGHGCTPRQAIDPNSTCVSTLRTSAPQDEPTLKIPQWAADPFPFTTWIWTSTPTPDAQKPATWIAGPTVWILGPELIPGAIPKTWDGYDGQPTAALCVRPMEPDILQTAKAAQVTVPVPDLQTLKAYVPLNNARLAYEAGNYQDTITQAQSALALDPHLQAAYWAIGISDGMLGQWDQAITNLNAAIKIDKSTAGDANGALEWAKASKKAAKKGQKPTIKGKPWPNPQWNAPWT